MYFKKLLKVAAEVFDKKNASSIIDGLSYGDLMKLAKQEAGYELNGIDPATTQSGREMLAIQQEIMNKVGLEPTKDVMKLALKESFFNKFDVSFMNHQQQKLMRKVAEADKNGNLLVRAYTKQFLQVMTEGRKFNLAPIDVDMHRADILMKHILGDGLSFDAFTRQIKFKKHKLKESVSTTSDGGVDTSYKTYKMKKEKGLVD